MKRVLPLLSLSLLPLFGGIAVGQSPFGTLTPTDDPVWYESSTYGLIGFPDANPASQWAYAYDLDSWVGVYSPGLTWSPDYGFLQSTGTRAFESSVFGPISVPARAAADVVIPISTSYLLGLDKFIGTPFYWSDTMLSYLGTTNASLYSFAWGFVTVVGPYTIDSATLGRLFLTTDPDLQGAVLQASTGRYLYPNP